MAHLRYILAKSTTSACWLRGGYRRRQRGGGVTRGGALLRSSTSDWLRHEEAERRPGTEFVTFHSNRTSEFLLGGGGGQDFADVAQSRNGKKIGSQN